MSNTCQEYNVGDKVWYVAQGYRIAILCTIRNIDDYFRKQDPRAYLFYDLDEPIGHDVDVEEINFNTKEDARDYLLTIHDDYGGRTDWTLEEFRRKQIDFIVGTWRRAGCTDEFINDYHDKKRLIQWFNVQDILDGKV